MWRVYRDAGRPWPVLSDDDVIDYIVMEAVALKVRKQEADAQKAEERRAWQQQQKEKLKEMVR